MTQAKELPYVLAIPEPPALPHMRFGAMVSAEQVRQVLEAGDVLARKVHQSAQAERAAQVDYLQAVILLRRWQKAVMHFGGDRG